MGLIVLSRQTELRRRKRRAQERQSKKNTVLFCLPAQFSLTLEQRYCFLGRYFTYLNDIKNICFLLKTISKLQNYKPVEQTACR